MTTGVNAIPGAAEARRIYFGYWLALGAFVAQFVSVGSQNYVIGVFLKPMTDDLGWTRSDFTWARTGGQVVMAAVGLVVGGYVDRNGGRRLMFVGAAVLGVALYLTSYINELWQWFVLNGIMLSVGAALVGNLVVNVTLARWFVERRGRMVGIAAMGVSFAGVVIPPIMSPVVDEWGWRAGWRVLAVAAVALVWPITLLMRRAPEDYGLHPDGKSAEQVAAGGGQRAAADYANSMTRQEALHSGQFYLMVLAFGLFTVSIGVLLIHTIPFLTDAGYSREAASLMITVVSIPALVSKPVWGIFIDKTDPKRLTALSAVITGGSLALIVLAVHQEMSFLAVAGFIILGLGWGGLIPLQEVTWASYFGRRHLGAIRSAALPFSLLVGAGAPQIAAVYYDRVGNYDGAFLTIAALCFVAAVLILQVRKREMRAPGQV
jgi:MFS transporter, OFA family, oxalate/formate antiporter